MDEPGVTSVLNRVFTAIGFFCIFVSANPFMRLLAAKIVTALVVFLMIFEIVGAAVTSLPANSDHALNYHTKKPSSVFSSFIFEKAEEENEKTEEEKDGMSRVVLIDFNRVAVSLSIRHTPQIHFTRSAFQYDVRPSFHVLHCVFLI